MSLRGIERDRAVSKSGYDNFALERWDYWRYSSQGQNTSSQTIGIRAAQEAGMSIGSRRNSPRELLLTYFRGIDSGGSRIVLLLLRRIVSSQ
jgi:hypothetical protein